jgi:hypothetical protein
MFFAAGRLGKLETTGPLGFSGFPRLAAVQGAGSGVLSLIQAGFGQFAQPNGSYLDMDSLIAENAKNRRKASRLVGPRQAHQSTGKSVTQNGCLNRIMRNSVTPN